MYYIVSIDEFPRYILSKERYKVFDNLEKAYEYAQKYGWKGEIGEDIEDGTTKTSFFGEYGIVILAQKELNK